MERMRGKKEAEQKKNKSEKWLIKKTGARVAT